MPVDQVVLVNEQDEVIGTMDKVEAHRGDAKLHRAISVYLLRKKGRNIELLIQQRSNQKIVGAGQWANTCCGNVLPGESYEECAQRRLKEELGIAAASFTPVYKFRYQAKCNEEFSEHEIDQVFAGWYEGDVAPNPAEVSQTQWINIEQLREEMIGDHTLSLTEKKYAPWFHIMLGHHDVLTKVIHDLNKGAL